MSDEKPKVKTSTASKTRKSLFKLQQMKDRGEKIVQMCPAGLGGVFGLAAEMAGCDILRTPGLIGRSIGNEFEEELTVGTLTIATYRTYTNIIHLNYYMPTALYADKSLAVRWGARWTWAGADSMLPMGVTNEILKFMSDNYVPTYGHIGAISGWQTNATGYKRVGKTAEDAFRIFKWGYEYQENGMGGMTIELTPIEVSNAIAKKLRVPVVSIAGGGACDGSEMVDMDTFGINPNLASHAKKYIDLLPILIETYAAWAKDVREGDYPEDKHGYHMDAEELEKFQSMMDAV